MSPLKIDLLLRCWSSPYPTTDMPEAQALSPAMRQAVQDFKAAGILLPHITVFNLRTLDDETDACRDRREIPKYLTEAGLQMVVRIMDFADDALKEASK